MYEFLSKHAPIVSAFASMGTPTIWAIYLHLFVKSYRRQLKPVLIINLGEGRNLDARCFVTNMSRDSIHIQSVVARLITGEKVARADITDTEDIRKAGRPAGWQRTTRQGPLSPGSMVEMGSYRYILDYVIDVQSDDDKAAFADGVDAIEITIIGIYGTEDLLVGADRRFNLERSRDEIVLVPSTIHTRQITNTSERRALATKLGSGV